MKDEDLHEERSDDEDCDRSNVINTRLFNSSQLKLKFALKDALDRGVPYLVVVGDEEWKVGNVKVKDLAAKEEEEVAIGDVAGWVRAREGGESGGSSSGSSRPAAKKEKKVFAWDEKDFIR